MAFEESRLNSIPVKNGQTDILGTTAWTGVKILDREVKDAGGTEKADSAKYKVGWREGLLLRSDENIKVECRMKESLTAPVPQGMEVGWIDYIVEGTVYKREHIVTTDAVGQIDMEWCVRQIIKRFLFP